MRFYSIRRPRIWRATVLLTLALGLAVPVEARNIEGVEFRETVQVGGIPLQLNAVGLLRYMVFIKAYVAGLYLGPGVRPDQILSDTAKRLEIEYFYPIAKEQFATSTEAAIRQNVGAEEFEALRPQIARFNALYRDVEPYDRYALTYLPGVGTELALNGEPLGVVEGRTFGQAVFSIWFGEAAIDGNLKKTLLRSG